jgi:hypothetical protein
MRVGGGTGRLPPRRLLLIALLLAGVVASARIGSGRLGLGGGEAQRSNGRERGTGHRRVGALLVLVPCAAASGARHLRLRGGFDVGRPLDDDEDDRGVGYDPEGFADGDVGVSDQSVRDLDLGPDGMDDPDNSRAASSRGQASENIDDTSGAIPSGVSSEEADDDSRPPASNPDGADDLTRGSTAQHRVGDGHARGDVLKYHSSSDAEGEELKWLSRVDELVAKDDAQLVESMRARDALEAKAEALADEKRRAWQAPLSSHRSQVEHDRRERQALREQVASQMGWHERLLQDEMRRANGRPRVPTAMGVGREHSQEEAGGGGPAEPPCHRGHEHADLRERARGAKFRGAERSVGAAGTGSGGEGGDGVHGRSSQQRGEDAGTLGAVHAGVSCLILVCCLYIRCGRHIPADRTHAGARGPAETATPAARDAR